ncbi:MAG: tetratricopeptide (TPR) repeat protein [Chlamydiales bacterium]|jgi:tetratricopeptide (TPR) repeat protein
MHPPPSLSPTTIPTTEEPPLPAGQRVALALILGLVTVAVFWQSISGDLVYDDLLLVGRNTQIMSLEGVLSALGHPYWAFDAPDEGPLVGFWRPLTTVVLALGNWIGNGDPVAFHLLSLALHILASLICWRLIARLSARPRLAFVGALLFALHPVHVESVAWISAVNDPLYTVFALLSLDAFARWRLTDTGSESARPPLGAGLWLFCALLAKEQALAVLTAALAVDVTLAGRKVARPERSGLRSYMPLLVACAGYVLLRMWVFEDLFAGLDRRAAHFELGWPRLLGYWVELFGGFLTLLVWPADLVVFRQVRPQLPALDPAFITGAIAVGTWSIGVLLTWRRGRRDILGALLFLPAALAPVLLSFQSAGAFPLSDRYLYLAVAGWSLLFVLGAAQLLKRPLATAIGLLMVVGYGMRAHAHVGVFQGDEAFFRAAVKSSPRTPYVHWGMGRVLLDRYQVERDKPLLDEALLHFLTSLYLGADYGEHGPKLPPDAPLRDRVSELNAVVNDTPAGARKPDPTVSVSRSDREQANIGLGWCYLFLAELPPEYDLSTPLYVFEQTVKLFPRSYRALTGLGAVHLRRMELDLAIETFDKALALHPEHSETWHNLGQAHIKKLAWDDALEAFEQALKFRPEHLADMVGIATTAIEAGRFEVAEATLAEARRIHADSLEPLFWSGMLAARQRDFPRALNWFDAVLGREQGHGYAHLERGRLLLQMDETQAAIKALGRACELISDSFEAHYNLGSLLLARINAEEATPYLVRAFELSSKGTLRGSLHYKLREILAGDGEPASQLARLSVRRGEYGQAHDWLTDAIRAGEPWASSARLHHSRGEALQRLEQLPEAVGAYKRSLELDAGRFWTNHNLGMLLAQMGRQAEAIPYLEAAQRQLSQIDRLDKPLRDTISAAIAQGIEGNLDFTGPSLLPIESQGLDERWQ